MCMCTCIFVRAVIVMYVCACVRLPNNLKPQAAFVVIIRRDVGPIIDASLSAQTATATTTTAKNVAVVGVDDCAILAHGVLNWEIKTNLDLNGWRDSA